MIDLLCLAYSRKYSSRCVAGLRLDTLEWVRPISATEHGEISASNCRLDVGRPPKPLDVVRIPLQRARPERHQPENWLLREGQWQLVDELSVRAAAVYLDRVVLPGPSLLGDTADSIDWDWIQQNGMGASLGIVRVRPDFYVNPWGNLRALFALKGVRYNLSVTDLAAWTNDARQPGFRVQSNWYLTISLGERFDQKNRAYKLVAAGIEVHG
jgi:hypothetical protein